MGWTDGKDAKQFCTIDPVCAKSLSDAHHPLLAKLATLATMPEGASNLSVQNSIWLLKQLAVSLGHPPYLDELLRHVISMAVSRMESALRGDRRSVPKKWASAFPNFVTGFFSLRPADAFCNDLLSASGLITRPLDFLKLCFEGKAALDNDMQIMFIDAVDSIALARHLHAELRSSGIIPRLAGLVKLSAGKAHPCDWILMQVFRKLSRIEPLHNSLREEGDLLAVALIFLNKPKGAQHADITYRILVCIAHVYGGEASCHPAQQLLSRNDVGSTAVQMMKDVVLLGKSKTGQAAEEVLHALKSLTINSDVATSIASIGATAPLASIIQGDYGTAEQRRSRDPDKALDVLIKACGVALNLSYVPQLRDQLRQSELMAALRAHASHPDWRVSDETKGALLNLETQQPVSLKINTSSLSRVDSAAAAEAVRNKPKFDIFLRFVA